MTDIADERERAAAKTRRKFLSRNGMARAYVTRRIDATKRKRLVLFTTRARVVCFLILTRILTPDIGRDDWKIRYYVIARLEKRRRRLAFIGDRAAATFLPHVLISVCSGGVARRRACRDAFHRIFCPKTCRQTGPY